RVGVVTHREHGGDPDHRGRRDHHRARCGHDHRGPRHHRRTLTGPATVRATFAAGRGFPLDRFQLLALDALDAGRSVLVAAPTGSGKTLVAEYAIDRAR